MTVKELANFFKISYDNTSPEKKGNLPHKAPSQDDINFFMKKSPPKNNQNHSVEMPKHAESLPS